MKIPINREYVFTVKVLEDDSFNPQDLTDMTNASFSVYTMDGGTKKFEVSGSNTNATNGYYTTNNNVVRTTTTEVSTKDANGLEIDYTKSTATEIGSYSVGTVVHSNTVNNSGGTTTTTTTTTVGVAAYTGVITFTVKEAATSLLEETIGLIEDNYYTKAGYRGSIIVEFNNSRPDINVLIEKITAVKV